MTVFIIYIIFSIAAAGYIVNRTKPEFSLFTFMLILWILTFPVMQLDQFIIKIPGLPFEFQFERIIFLVFFSWIIISLSFKKVQYSQHSPLYEKLFLALLAICIISNIFNFEILQTRQFILNFSRLLTILSIYLTVKYTADYGMFKAIYKALILVCCISCLVAFYQYTVDFSFFRTGFLRSAFENKYRATGIFQSEYYQSYFLICGILWTLHFLENKKIKFFLTALFISGVILTFHRMSWIILIASLGLYYIRSSKISFTPVIFSILTISAISFLSYTIISDRFRELSQNKIVKERLMDNTISGRMQQYNMVLKNFDKHILFGFGNEKNEIYYRAMMLVGGKSWATGKSGTIHNGFLYILFFNGLPAALLFFLFLVVSLKYYNRLINEDFFHIIVSLIIFIYFASNLTNSFEITSELGILFIFHLALGYAVKYRHILELSDSYQTA
jgi:hypothetical protein